MTIDGTAILITGASAGIGAALAAELHRRGARLALTGRDPGRLRAAAPPGAWTLPGDLADPAFRPRLLEEAERAVGPLGGLVNNAGVGLYAPPSASDPESVRAMFELNYFAPAGLIRLALPGMRARRHGIVVNVSSIAGRITLPWFTHYSATKAALTAFTEGLRAELAGSGVHPMLVSPGYVRTGFQDHVLAGSPPARLKQARRFAVAADTCARAIAAGIEQDREEVVTPWSGRLLLWAARCWPRLVAAQLASMNRDLGMQP